MNSLLSHRHQPKPEPVIWSQGWGKTNKMLAEALREMEEDGLILKHPDEGQPGKVRYALTEMGAALRPAADALYAWGRKYIEAQGQGHRIYRKPER